MKEKYIIIIVFIMTIFISLYSINNYFIRADRKIEMNIILKELNQELDNKKEKYEIQEKKIDSEIASIKLSITPLLQKRNERRAAGKKVEYKICMNECIKKYGYNQTTIDMCDYECDENRYLQELIDAENEQRGTWPSFY